MFQYGRFIMALEEMDIEHISQTFSDHQWISLQTPRWGICTQSGEAFGDTNCAGNGCFNFDTAFIYSYVL